MNEPIAELVHPILHYGLRLQERLRAGETPILDTEQATLKGMLLSGSEARRWIDFGGEAEPVGRGADDEPGRNELFLGVRYALVCWLDEIFVLDSPWESAWNERKLEAALYGSNDRAWKFWDQASRAELRPGSDALEVFYLCVMLGFRGELREDAGRLRTWVEAVRARIVKEQPTDWPAPAELEPPTNVPPLHGRKRLQRMILTAGGLLLLLIPVVAFFIVQHLSQ
jgi:type VI secretion system protein ImpK